MKPQRFEITVRDATYEREATNAVTIATAMPANEVQRAIGKQAEELFRDLEFWNEHGYCGKGNVTA